MAEHRRAVEARRGLGPQGRPGLIRLGDRTHGLRGAQGRPDLGLRQALPDAAGALGARLWMRDDDLYLIEWHLPFGDQAVADRQVVLADQGDAVGVEGEGVERCGD